MSIIERLEKMLANDPANLTPGEAWDAVEALPDLLKLARAALPLSACSLPTPVQTGTPSLRCGKCAGCHLNRALKPLFREATP